MESAKRLGNNCINERTNNKRKKLNETTIDLNDEMIKSITHFEDLSNDMIYEIFDFLDFRHIYDAFSNLNNRFKNLLTNSTLPININMSFMFRSNFEKYYKNLIIPYVHRIKLLHLSNPFSIDLLFTHDSILSKLIRLETLILNDIASEDVQIILTYLVTLPCVSSLIIFCTDGGNIRNTLFRQIFLLPVLKYCKISMNEFQRSEPLLPIANNELSSVEHLIINDLFDTNDLNAVLSCVPHLRRLSCKTLFPSSNEQINSCSIKLNHLTHASLEINDVTFHQFESLTKVLFHQLQVLYITASNDKTYLDANRWKQLILSHMPHLRIFNILCDIGIDKDDYSSYISMTEPFQSQFWLQRQWFFICKTELISDEYYRIYLSTIPYRRKSYSFIGNLDNDTVSNDQKHNIDSVTHVLFDGEQRIKDCKNYFPNTTRLTLCGERANTDWNFCSIILDNILPLTQLTKLNFNTEPCPFNTMIKVLSSIPNIETLVVQSVYFCKSCLASIQQTETFQSVSKRNKIKNLTLYPRYTSEEMKLFIHLCPRLEFITMQPADKHFEKAMQYLLMKDNPNVQHLFLIRIINASEKLVEGTQTVIKSQETMNDYIMKKVEQFLACNIYLWR